MGEQIEIEIYEKDYWSCSNIWLKIFYYFKIYLENL